MAIGTARCFEIMMLLLFIILSTIFYILFHTASVNQTNSKDSFTHLQRLFPSSPHNPSTQTIPETTTEKKVKIAYIFAGSVRSFVCPKVHWSIKAHLIDALGGDPHVFIRVATDDNKNTKTGLGILRTSDYEEHEVEETLKVLNPKVVQNFSFVNQVEEMKRNHPEMIHTVFRENDRRRYSMFYHRCMAYKIMLQYERDHHMRFDWVLLVRLDAGWLEPMLPITTYANDRVWVTETGFDIFNDQFMMIPRQYSDYLYDLNTKLKKEVYCLGGPDVEIWKCQRAELEKRGLEQDFIEETLKHCCPDVLKKGRNSMGYSERIHYRHLLNGKIPVSLGRFPVYLARRYENKKCYPECFRIYGYNYKYYVFMYDTLIYPYLKRDSWMDSRSTAISSRDRVLCYMMSLPSFAWRPLPAYKLHQQIRSNLSLSAGSDVVGTNVVGEREKRRNYTLDYSKPLYSQLNHVHPSIIQKPEDTAIWRIHPTWNVDGCLSYSYENKTLLWDLCHDHIRMRDMKNLLYDSRQLFFLKVHPLPMLKALPKLSEGLVQHPSAPWTFVRGRPEDLDPSTLGESQLSSGVVPTMRVMISHCEPVKWDFRKHVMCLTAEKLADKARVSVGECVEGDVRQVFQAVKPLAAGSHYQTVVGKLRFAAAPHLCLGRDDNVLRDYVKYPKSDKLFVYQCEWRGMQHLVQFEFELTVS